MTIRLSLATVVFVALATSQTCGQFKNNSIRFFAAPVAFVLGPNEDNSREQGPYIDEFAPLSPGETRSFRITLFSGDNEGWAGKFMWGTQMDFRLSKYFELGFSYRTASMKNEEHNRTWKWNTLGVRPRINFSPSTKKVVPYFAAEINRILFDFDQNTASLRASDNVLLTYKDFSENWGFWGFTAGLGLDVNLGERTGIFFEAAFHGAPMEGDEAVNTSFNTGYNFPGYFELTSLKNLEGSALLQFTAGFIFRFDLKKERDF